MTARPSPSSRPVRRGKPWRRRALLAIGVVVGLPLAILALVASSVWSENRFPSDASDASGLARARGVVTRPVVGAVSEHVRRRVRSAAQRRLEMTGRELSDLIAGMNDASRDPFQRRKDAIRLGRVKSPEAIRALIEAFQSAPPEDRAFFAQLLGSTGDAAVVPWLEPLLRDADDDVAIAALTGLCSVEGHDASAAVGRILWDVERSPAVRIAAAAGLGQLGTVAAREQLEAALRALPPVELRDQVLTSLGRYPFADVEPTFRSVVAAEGSSADTRIVAVEALFDSTADAVPFLLEVAGRDPDNGVRESAAWAIGAHEGDDDLGSVLADLAEREPEPDVRRRLYEAELTQRRIPAERLLPRASEETDVAARIAGWNAVGQAVGRNADADVAAAFDRDVVPELTRIAVAPNSVNIRMRAVFALRRAGTDAAQDALRTIVATAGTPKVADAARHGLRESTDE